MNKHAGGVNAAPSKMAAKDAHDRGLWTYSDEAALNREAHLLPPYRRCVCGDPINECEFGRLFPSRHTMPARVFKVRGLGVWLWIHRDCGLAGWPGGAAWSQQDALAKAFAHMRLHVTKRDLPTIGPRKFDIPSPRLPKWGAENGAENGKLTAQIKTAPAVRKHRDSGALPTHLLKGMSTNDR